MLKSFEERWAHGRITTHSRALLHAYLPWLSFKWWLLLLCLLSVLSFIFGQRLGARPRPDSEVAFSSGLSDFLPSACQASTPYYSLFLSLVIQMHTNKIKTFSRFERFRVYRIQAHYVNNKRVVDNGFVQPDPPYWHPSAKPVFRTDKAWIASR